jgi:hypothetical protein
MMETSILETIISKGEIKTLVEMETKALTTINSSNIDPSENY